MSDAFSGTTWSFHRALKERRVMIAFALIVGAVMFSSAAKILIIAFPAGCLVIAFTTIRRDGALFTEYITWLFFLTPFIRRVVDFETGARETVIISTPFLVLSVPALFALARWRNIVSRESSPLLYAMAAVLYGAFIACVHLELSSAVVGLTIWGSPLLFGLYLISERDNASRLYRGIERAILGGTLVAGLYGVIQYFAIPAWDAAWMRTVDMVTIGKPEPMEVRVFSMMNSPQVLAAFLMVGVLLAYRLRSPWKYPILLAGIASLALSFARSAWIGLLAGLTLYAFRAAPKERLRTITATFGCAALVLVALNVPQVSEALSTRFTTFEDLAHDQSALDRRDTYSQVIEILRRSPTGIGLGVDSGMSDAENDSSIVATLLSLGLPGSVVFVVALGICGFWLFSIRPDRELPYFLGLQCCIVSLAVESPLNNVIDGQIAFLTWSFIGLSCGGLMMRQKVLNSRSSLGYPTECLASRMSTAYLVPEE